MEVESRKTHSRSTTSGKDEEGTQASTRLSITLPTLSRPEKNKKSQSQAWYTFISFSYVCGLSGSGGRARGPGSRETRAGGTSCRR